MPRNTKTIGVRTEHLLIAKPNGGPVGQVRRIEHLGDQNHIHLDYNGLPLVTLADPHQPLSAGQEVGLQLIDPLYFDASGQRIALSAQ
jgi:multiple sugar transport system ATP-binding protein